MTVCRETSRGTDGEFVSWLWPGATTWSDGGGAKLGLENLSDWMGFRENESRIWKEETMGFALAVFSCRKFIGLRRWVAELSPASGGAIYGFLKFQRVFFFFKV